MHKMEIIKLIPENQTLDECINIFRQSLLDLGYANSSRVEVFLITKEKFEKMLRDDTQFDYLAKVHERYVKLLKVWYKD